MNDKKADTVEQPSELTDAENVSLQVEAQTPIDMTPLPAVQLPGTQLAARREELRWTLEEAADRLKLAPRQVASLEANDFAALPGMASVRGFIRSYAKAVGLDPIPLLEMLSSEPNPAFGPLVLTRPLPANGFPGRRTAPPPRRSKWRRRAALTIVLLSLAGGVGYEGYRSQWLTIPSFELPSINVSLPSLPDFGTDNAEVQSPSVSAENSVSESVPLINSSHSLELKLSEDAWVEITTYSGKKIVSRLIKAGTTEMFELTEPVVLVVGNASAVEAKLRGQPLNLKAVAHDNVSKLSLK